MNKAMKFVRHLPLVKIQVPLLVEVAILTFSDFFLNVASQIVVVLVILW